MLEENLRRWFEKARKEGFEEGLREGLKEGRRTVLLQQLTLRFGRLPASVRRQIEGISSLQELRKLGRKVLRAKTLQDMGFGRD